MKPQKISDDSLSRLIAHFPHVDVSILSTALERSENTDTAIQIVQKMTRMIDGGHLNSSQNKSRPMGSARMREQKVTMDPQSEDDFEEEKPKNIEKIQRGLRPASALKNGNSARSEGALDQIIINQPSPLSKDLVAKSHTSIHDESMDKSLSRSGATHDLRDDDEDDIESDNSMESDIKKKFDSEKVPYQQTKKNENIPAQPMKSISPTNQLYEPQKIQHYQKTKLQDSDEESDKSGLKK
ncbi:hypothetical protein HK096_010086 [Nowakowskiella sp. JEL0078]|nr:hypothetical protein HK096_010086 [Nowakowskiella sp. JEL0078]